MPKVSKNEVINRPPTDADIVDNTCNNQCSHCAGCCTAFLPWTVKETHRVLSWPEFKNVVPNFLSSSDPNHLFVFCPFLDKDTHLCQIYERRPLACRTFKCDQSLKTIHRNKELFHRRADYNSCGLSSHDKGNISTQALFFGDWAFDIQYRNLVAQKCGFHGSYEELKKLFPLIADKYVEVKDGKLIIHKGGK